MRIVVGRCSEESYAGTDLEYLVSQSSCPLPLRRRHDSQQRRYDVLEACQKTSRCKTTKTKSETSIEHVDASSAIFQLHGRYASKTDLL